MQNDDFKYVIQDTGCVYFGRELTYTEMMAREDVPFKFKAIINGHIGKDTDLNQTIAAHVLGIDTASFTYRIFERRNRGCLAKAGSDGYTRHAR